MHVTRRRLVLAAGARAVEMRSVRNVQARLARWLPTPFTCHASGRMVRR